MWVRQEDESSSCDGSVIKTLFQAFKGPFDVLSLGFFTLSVQMFLTVFRSEQQNASEVPITPQTLCRDVVEFCKEPGEGRCYLAEAWRSSGEALAAQSLGGG